MIPPPMPGQARRRATPGAAAAAEAVPGDVGAVRQCRIVPSSGFSAHDRAFEANARRPGGHRTLRMGTIFVGSEASLLPKCSAERPVGRPRGPHPRRPRRVGGSAGRDRGDRGRDKGWGYRQTVTQARCKTGTRIRESAGGRVYMGAKRRGGAKKGTPPTPRACRPGVSGRALVATSGDASCYS